MIWINNKINVLLSNECDEFSIAFLTTAIKQLNREKETLLQIDTRITKLIESPKDLTSAIFEAEIQYWTKQLRFEQHAHRQLEASPTPTSMLNDKKMQMLDTSPLSTATSPTDNVEVRAFYWKFS